MAIKLELEDSDFGHPARRRGIRDQRPELGKQEEKDERKIEDIRDERNERRNERDVGTGNGFGRVPGVGGWD
jgi:hypothetical protein